jgi:hypothetical protein
MDYRKMIQAISQYIPNPIAIELNKWVDELRKENDTLRDEVKMLKAKIADLESPSANKTIKEPSCPNCSTVGRPFFMSPISNDFIEIENATHECPRCKFKTRIK